MSDDKKTDLKKVKELIELMKANDLVELEIADGENKILLKRPQPVAPTVTHVPLVHSAVSVPAASADPASEPATSEQTQDEGLVDIISPMVGTFYLAPSPDSDPFVSVGASIDNESIVCIIEAMKVMNEIKAETIGTIEKIMCEAGQAVEYGQVLFKVRPD